MILNNVPEIKITSNNKEQNIYSVVPNFVMINQPEVKALETKVKRNRKLIVWFDVRNEHSHGDGYAHATTILKNFNFQLTLHTAKGNVQMKAANFKDPASFEEWIIRNDEQGILIDENKTLVYEISDDKAADNFEFSYVLNYENNQRYGLTYNGINGSNRGAIIINDKNSDDEIVFNNAYAYLENDKQQVRVLNQDSLIVNEQRIKRINNLGKPLFEITTRNETDLVEQLAKSQQIRAELAKISDNGINYLQSLESTLKTTKKVNAYQIEETLGNHYDFQTNKWVNDVKDKTSFIADEQLKLSFEFNYQKFDLNLNVIDDLKIRNINSTSKELVNLHSYQDVKPNTKFNTFVASRNV